MGSRVASTPRLDLILGPDGQGIGWENWYQNHSKHIPLERDTKIADVRVETSALVSLTFSFIHSFFSGLIKIRFTTHPKSR